jgi:hypothetical protein
MGQQLAGYQGPKPAVTLLQVHMAALGQMGIGE